MTKSDDIGVRLGRRGGVSIVGDFSKLGKGGLFGNGKINIADAGYVSRESGDTTTISNESSGIKTALKNLSGDKKLQLTNNLITKAGLEEAASLLEQAKYLDEQATGLTPTEGGLDKAAAAAERDKVLERIAYLKTSSTSPEEVKSSLSSVNETDAFRNQVPQALADTRGLAATNNSNINALVTEGASSAQPADSLSGANSLNSANRLSESGATNLANSVRDQIFQAAADFRQSNPGKSIMDVASIFPIKPQGVSVDIKSLIESASDAVKRTV